MKNFDKYFKRQLNISKIKLDLAFMKLNEPEVTNGENNLQSKEGRYPSQSGESEVNPIPQSGAIEAVNGAEDIPTG